jgi:hypothetical protein
VKKQSYDLELVPMRITGKLVDGQSYISRAEFIGWLAECEIESNHPVVKRTLAELRRALKTTTTEVV